jgi:hypothetical protein
MTNCVHAESVTNFWMREISGHHSTSYRYQKGIAESSKQRFANWPGE